MQIIICWKKWGKFAGPGVEINKIKTKVRLNLATKANKLKLGCLFDIEEKTVLLPFYKKNENKRFNPMLNCIHLGILLHVLIQSLRFCRTCHVICTFITFIMQLFPSEFPARPYNASSKQEFVSIVFITIETILVSMNSFTHSNSFK